MEGGSSRHHRAPGTSLLGKEAGVGVGNTRTSPSPYSLLRSMSPGTSRSCSLQNPSARPRGDSTFLVRMNESGKVPPAVSTHLLLGQRPSCSRRLSSQSPGRDKAHTHFASPVYCTCLTSRLGLSPENPLITAATSGWVLGRN